MSKFDDIRIGDTVYLQVSLYNGFTCIGDYWFPHHVEKVTPKQFQIKGKKYRKSDGTLVQSGYHNKICRKLGESYGFQGKEIVTDQTDNFREVQKQIDISTEIYHLSKKLHVSYKHKNLDEIYNKVKEINELIEQE